VEGERQMKKLLFKAIFLSIAIILVSAPFAISDNIVIYQDSTFAQSGNVGGEFRVASYFTTDPVVQAAHDSYGLNVNYAAGFQSFCLEHNEYFTPGHAYYTYNLSYGAINGGLSGGNPDPVSIGTAYLYSQFASGSLAGYNYLSGRLASAMSLQNAIWYLEGELQLTTQQVQGNAFLQDVLTRFGNYQYNGVRGATADANGGYGVHVLNVWDGRNPCQDQLIYIPTPEPVTLFLYGFGLIGLAVWRRCRKN
jgi:hypothetical protein